LERRPLEMSIKPAIGIAAAAVGMRRQAAVAEGCHEGASLAGAGQQPAALAVSALACDRGLERVILVFAEFERSIIQERIHAGLARACTKGVRLGRPPRSSVWPSARSSPLGLPPPTRPPCAIARELGCPNATCAVFLPSNDRHGVRGN
jgi:hypothetical protein